MNSEASSSTATLMADAKSTDLRTQNASAAPSPANLATKRQLKDYPQSLQTAARALWD